MKRLTLVLVICLVLFPVTVFSQSVDDLTLYTEQYPPFNFEEGGRLQGISIDLMEEMLARAGSGLSRADIELVPWSLGYERAQDRPNHAVFAMTRTAARENLFKWVGPISPTKVVLTGKQGANISINSISDVQRYTIGTVRDDVGEAILLEQGVPRRVLDPVPSPDPNVQKLAADRIDLWAYEESVARWLINSAGFNVGDYETYWVLSEAELYFGFNPGTPDAVIRQLQDALDSIRADGTYDRIVASYLD